MDWGDKFEKIVAAASSVGVGLATLPCVVTRVDLADELQFEWRAFKSLSSDRQVGMGIGPIAWSSIDRFALRYNICGDEFDRFTSIIQSMDAAYLDYGKDAN